ncbi:MAG: hypothetical protein E5Y16_25345 [Mesorhizobium sp.]|nr:MAG: hypothetical protein EOS08_27180 [Mesorhizobium sp.]TJV28160.1 MAG: hypothetical protein E5Y16_25345 [Mesorhizobium sp.]
MEINYSTLEADVAAWVKAHIAATRDICGPDEAYAVAVTLEAEPWTALQWYVEDMRASRP